ncbi:MAG: single-stranded-DNA-specific exonuclease RecJ [Nitrospinae bacterium]|nr:single-stranded-DNA-specific exonuclease RecJ [Nitrospinota bacterium]
MSRRRWVVSEGDPAAEAGLCADTGVDPVMARLLVNRGAKTSSQARVFLDAPLTALLDPFLMKGMTEAVERVIKARQAGEKVVVFGDYDVDGVTATASLLLFLRQVGLSAGHYIPERATEGYGMSEAAIDVIRGDLGASLIITVDNGINANAAVDYATAAGVDVIITDHHQPGEAVPNAAAVLNPNQPGCEYPCKSLAGVGIAFKLCMAVRSELLKRGAEKESLPNLKKGLDLVAIGSVADCAPLTGENWLLARHGIAELSSSAKPGIRALKEVGGLNGGRMTARDIAFNIAPRLNAVGRLGKADCGVELLLTCDLGRGRSLARFLDDENKRRQDIQRRMFEEAREQAASSFRPEVDKIILVGSDKWNQGVAGIVASKLVEEFNVPAAVVCFCGDTGKGSARSVQPFDITAALSAMSAKLVKFGGHKIAAGFTVRREMFESFREGMLALAAAGINGDDAARKILIDCQIPYVQIDKALVKKISSLEPFGEGNPQPVFLSRNVAFTSLSYMGPEGRSVRLGMDNGMEALGFSMAGRFSGVDAASTRFDIVYTPEVSTWRDVERVQLRLIDVEPAAP